MSEEIEFIDSIKSKGNVLAVEARVEGLRVIIHRHNHYPKDQWLLSCRPFFDCYKLPAKELADAQIDALQLLCSKTRNIADAFEKTLKVFPETG